MNNRNVCVRNLPRNVPEYQVRDFFNSLSSGQVENVLRTAGYVLLTFLSPDAAKTVMEMGGGLEVGGARVHLSWWLARDVYSSQPRPAVKSAGQAVRPSPAGESPLVQQAEEMIGPVEKLHQVSLGQGWGVPQYSCSSYLDNNNQQVYQYSVTVPAVPNSVIPGEVSHDRQLAMMNCACAALQGIARETQKKFSSENSLTSLQGPLLQSAAANTATATASVLYSQEAPAVNQRPRQREGRGGYKSRKSGAARRKLQARHQ